MRVGWAIVGVVVAVVSLRAATVLQDQPPPAFRTGTETVAIYATVLNRYGEPVRGLTADDFEVYDDGRRQALTVFEAGLQPISAAVMVDTSASMTLNLQQATLAAEQFVIRLLPGDRARVGHFSDRVDLSEQFTADRDSLLRSLRDLRVGNPTRLWDAVDATLEALAPLGGRRVLVLLTDGTDTASDTEADDVLARAAGSEVMVYVVQFRSNRQASLAEFSRAPSAGEVLASNQRRDARESPRELARLAQQSGGSYFRLDPTDDVNATFSALLTELHYQYVIGFTPERADGRLHSLDVRVDTPDLIVRARRSYRADGPPPPAS